MKNEDSLWHLNLCFHVLAARLKNQHVNITWFQRELERGRLTMFLKVLLIVCSLFKRLHRLLTGNFRNRRKPNLGVALTKRVDLRWSLWASPVGSEWVQYLFDLTNHCQCQTETQCSLTSVLHNHIL